jgi:RNA polymerase sigma factor (sigma-70 family)
MGSQRSLLARIETLYRDRGGDYFRFAVARTGNPEIAQDAVQEGFARAIRARRAFRGAGSLDAWVARCVINAANDLAEPRKTDSQQESGGGEQVLADQSVRAAIRSLPIRQREALFLRFYLDLDYASIAELLSVEVGTVSATLHAARVALAQSLKEVAT